MSTEPCRCETYPFPHRHYGGECRGHNLALQAEESTMTLSLDQGEWSTDNSYICRSCKQYIYGSRYGRLAGFTVCPSCRARYELERDAAEAAVDHRWLAKLHSED